MSDLGEEACQAQGMLQLLLEIDLQCQTAVTNCALMLEQSVLKTISTTEWFIRWLFTYFKYLIFIIYLQSRYKYSHFIIFFFKAESQRIWRSQVFLVNNRAAIEIHFFLIQAQDSFLLLSLPHFPSSIFPPILSLFFLSLLFLPFFLLSLPLSVTIYYTLRQELLTAWGHVQLLCLGAQPDLGGTSGA